MQKGSLIRSSRRQDPMFGIPLERILLRTTRKHRREQFGQTGERGAVSEIKPC